MTYGKIMFKWSKAIFAHPGSEGIVIRNSFQRNNIGIVTKKRVGSGTHYQASILCWDIINPRIFTACSAKHLKDQILDYDREQSDKLRSV